MLEMDENLDEEIRMTSIVHNLHWTKYISLQVRFDSTDMKDDDGNFWELWEQVKATGFARLFNWLSIV